MRSVLVTRPQPAADEFAEKLRREGFYAYVAPMTEYVDVYADLENLSPYQAMIFTSARGVQAFAGRSSARNLPVLAVGDATATAARQAGFEKIYSAQGDSGDIANLVKAERVALGLKKAFHPCSEDTTEDIGSAVVSLGVEVVRVPVYQAKFIDYLPPDVLQALERGTIDTVTLFSARTAANLVKLLQSRRLRGASAKMEAICISERVAAALKDIPWRAVRVAPKPDTESVLEVLKGQQQGRVAFAPLPAEQVINAFGGIRPLANRLGITASTVQGWQKRGTIPEARVADVLEAANEDKIDVDVFWQEGHREMQGKDNTGKPDSSKDRREKSDRRQKMAHRDEHGVIRADTYSGHDRRSGYDRRAHEKRQQDRVLKEKMLFLNRSALTFAFSFIAIVVVAVFLMGPEYADMQSRAKLEDFLEEQMQRIYPDAHGKKPETSIGGALNKRIEGMQNITVPVADMAGQITSAATEMFSSPGFSELSLVLDNLSALRVTKEGRASVARSLKTLRSLLAQTPSQPGAINNAVDAARRHDPTLEALLKPIKRNELAAAAMLLMLNEFRSNVDNHRPYAEDLALLQRFSGNDPDMNKALHALSPYAERGVMNRAALQKELKSLAADIVMAQVTGQDISVQEEALKRLNKLSRVQRVTDIKGGSPEAAVARAQLLLNRGDVKGAMRELKVLEGPSAEAAAPWIDNASGYVVASESSDSLVQNMLQGISSNPGYTAANLLELIRQKLGVGAVSYISPAMMQETDGGQGILAP